MRLRRALVQITGDKLGPVASRKIEKDTAEHIADIKQLSATLHAFSKRGENVLTPADKKRLTRRTNKQVL